MIFGERQSESPRVPSPWTNSQRRKSSPRTAPTLATTAKPPTPPFDIDCAPKDTFISTSRFSPLSRAVLCGKGVIDGHGASVHLTAHDLEDGHNDSLTSTPPTEEDDDVPDGFFGLDTDLDVLNLCGVASSHKEEIVKHFPPLAREGAAGDVVASAVKVLAPRSSQRPTRLAPEPDLAGNLEYKLRILPPTRHRYDKLLTQLQWRLFQGGGECTYEIGVLDDGLCIGLCSLEMRASLCVLASMASELDAIVRVSKVFHVVSSAAEFDADLETVASDLRTMSSIDSHAALLAPLADEAHAVMCSCGQSAQSLNDATAYIPQRLGHGDANTATTIDCAASLAELITIDVAPHDGPDSNVDTFLAQVQPEDGERRSGKGSSSDCAGSDAGDGGGSPLDTVPTIPFDCEDDEQQDLTFSLSLDERATRSGFGYRRPPTEQRRPSRYSPKNAAASLHHRTSIAAQQPGSESSGSESPFIGRRKATPRSSYNAVKMLARRNGEAIADVGRLSDEAAPTAARPPLPACTRLIVEATVLRAGSESKAFIDYSSI